MAVFICITCSSKRNSLQVINTTTLNGVLVRHLGRILMLQDETRPMNLKEFADKLPTGRNPFDV